MIPRQSQGVHYFPPLFYSKIQCLLASAKNSSFYPFGNCQGFSKSTISFCYSSIVLLNKSIRPSTIGRKIVSIWIDSIYKKIISVPIFKRPILKYFKIKPGRMNFYPPPPIILINFASWIKTSLFHSLPSMINAGTFESMTQHLISCFYSCQTSTICGLSGNQTVRINKFFFITRTSAQDFPGRIYIQYSPRTKGFANNNIFHTSIIRKRGGDWNMNMIDDEKFVDRPHLELLARDA